MSYDKWGKWGHSFLWYHWEYKAEQQKKWLSYRWFTVCHSFCNPFNNNSQIIFKEILMTLKEIFQTNKCFLSCCCTVMTNLCKQVLWKKYNSCFSAACHSLCGMSTVYCWTIFDKTWSTMVSKNSYKSLWSLLVSKSRMKITILQALVVQRLDSAIHQINLYPVDSASGFPNTYLLDSDLSGG